MDAFIIVDMLNDFIRKDGSLRCGRDPERIIQPILARLAEARARGDRIIYLCDSHTPNDPEFKLWPPHCVTGTRGAQIIDELAPIKNDSVLSKRKYSGFYGTNLEKILKKIRAKHATVTGVCTSICVMDTVGGLSDREIPVTVYRDCVSDIDPEMHECALKRMSRIYRAEVV